jgi:DsbC/DsbD-like thiol-disulfide interchange protein
MFEAAMRSQENPNRHNSSLRAALAAFTCAGALLAAQSAPAADATDWVGDAQSAARLLAGSAEADGATHRAGVEIRLAPGWKTYWRYPGDSGVPPHFDFAGSDNIKNVTVFWPAPQRIAGAEDVTIGYKNGVTFPLRVEAADPQKPVTLRLKLDYAICDKLCVPADAQTELKLSGQAHAHSPSLAAAEARVPQAVKIGAGNDLSIVSARRDDTVSPARIVVDVKAPSGAKADLFAEGPTPDWALPVPERIDGGAPGTQRFSFAVDGVPPGASARGAQLTLTATAGERAIEAHLRLD